VYEKGFNICSYLNTFRRNLALNDLYYGLYVTNRSEIYRHYI